MQPSISESLSLPLLAEIGAQLRQSNQVLDPDKIAKLAPLVKKSCSFDINMVLPDVSMMTITSPEKCNNECRSRCASDATSDSGGGCMSCISSNGDDACTTGESSATSGLDYNTMDMQDDDIDDDGSYYLPMNALQQACYSGHANVIIPLLMSDADQSTKVDAPGYEFSDLSAYQIAEQRGHYDCLEKFHEYNTKCRSRSTSASSMNYIDDADTYDRSASCTNSCIDTNDIYPQEMGYRAKSGWAARCADYDSDAGTRTSLSPNSSANTSAHTSRCSSRCSSPIPNSRELQLKGRGEAEVEVTNLDLKDTKSPLKYAIGSEDGYKQPNEDRIVVLSNIIENCDLYCVFDGHGGKWIADTLSKKLPELIQEKLHKFHQDSSNSNLTSDEVAKLYANIMKDSFIEFDKNLTKESERNFLLRQGGSTAVTSLVTPTHIIVANIGDTPCMIFESNNAQVLYETVDHTPSNETERLRVEMQGAVIEPGNHDGELRIKTNKGQISVTRAFGQVSFKKDIPLENHIIIAEPEINIWKRDLSLVCEKEDTAEFENAFATNDDEIDMYTFDELNELADSSQYDKVASEGQLGKRNSVPVSRQRKRSRTTDGILESSSIQLSPNKGHIINNNSSSNSNNNKRILMALYSDSFSEAVVNNPLGDKEASGRPRQIIQNILPNTVIAKYFASVYNDSYGDLDIAARSIASRQTSKFLFDGKYHGDNTSIVLVDLSASR
jgi:serine/threonine protein phosphatase PrpC